MIKKLFKKLLLREFIGYFNIWAQLLALKFLKYIFPGYKSSCKLDKHHSIPSSSIHFPSPSGRLTWIFYVWLLQHRRGTSRALLTWPVCFCFLSGLFKNQHNITIKATNIVWRFLQLCWKELWNPAFCLLSKKNNVDLLIVGDTSNEIMSF